MTQATMRAVQAQVAGAPFVNVEMPVPEPKFGQVRIKVHACGICGGDEIPRDGLFGTTLPRVPGHEIGGVVDAVGDGTTRSASAGPVAATSPGVNRTITGASFDGGYAEYMVAPQDAVARAPEELPFEEIAPMMCGGITAFNGLPHSKAGPGDTVAVHGVGGVGHLAVQFADKMGFRVVAIARGAAREDLAHRLGATEYIDSTAVDDVGQALQALGGATVIFDTVSRGNLQSALVSGLRPEGQLIVAEGFDPIQVTGHALAFPRLNISGWYSGVAADSEDTLNFAALQGVHPIIETHPLADAEQTFQNRNKANIRPVLIP